MALFGDLSGIDTNNPANLRLFSETLLFKHDWYRVDLTFMDRPTSEQRTLQIIAHSLELEYEYSTLTRAVRISRPFDFDTSYVENFQYEDSGYLEQFPTFDPMFGMNDLGVLDSDQQNSTSAAMTDTQMDFEFTTVASSGESPEGVVQHDVNIAFNINIPNADLTRARRRKALDSNTKTSSQAKIKCPDCVETFDRKADLRRHRLAVHIAVQPDNEPDIRPRRGARGVAASRSESVRSNGSTGYEEIVFDSRSTHSGGSQGSVGSIKSGGSGRRGPLSRWARAGMIAVKKIGACWRCKFMKRSCDTESPCAVCSIGSMSDWGALGCKRGEFQPPIIKLCQPPSSTSPNDTPDIEMIEAQISSQCCLQLANENDPWFQEGRCNDNAAPAFAIVPEQWEIRQRFLRTLENTRMFRMNETLPSQLTPLKQCALAIILELLRCPDSRYILGEMRSFEDFMQLLPFAIVYQAEHQEDQIISQSLICLRTCVEALRAKASGLLEPCWHTACELQSCKVGCIDNLNMHLSLFMRELSRVFFKKENLRNKRPWWLPAFYSFCIQSIVRRALIRLTQDEEIDGNNAIAQDKRQYELVTKIGKQLQSAYVVFAISVREELILQDLSFTEEVRIITKSWYSLPSMEKETYLREALSKKENNDWELAPIYGKDENPSLLLLFESKLERRILNFNLSAELTVRKNEKTSTSQYLYLPLRLFVAISGKLDSIVNTSSWNSAETNPIDRDDDMEAQLAVGQPTWLPAGIDSSFDYLKRLFQDDGRPLGEVAPRIMVMEIVTYVAPMFLSDMRLLSSLVPTGFTNLVRLHGFVRSTPARSVGKLFMRSLSMSLRCRLRSRTFRLLIS